MKRDPRTVLQQVKFIALALGILIAAAVCVQFIPVHRIEAWVWHARHHGTLQFGRYRLTVPKHWYIQHFSDNGALLVNLDNGDGVLLIKSGEQPLGVGTHPLFMVEERMNTPAYRITGKRELHIADESFVCIEGDFDTGKFHLYPVHCMSNGLLDVSFVPHAPSDTGNGSDFYELLGSLRKADR